MLVPRHVAIIMDGNGRWAKERGVPTVSGHREGVNALKRTIKAAQDLGIEYLTVYAFSVENWKRSKEEINALFNLMRRFLKKSNKDIVNKNIRLMFIGTEEGMPKDIIERTEELTGYTKNNKKLTLVIALNYGSRNEIVEAVKKICNDVKENRVKIDEVDEKIFSDYLYTKNIPDPDLLIRTSGEMRVSNFLLWQISYAEFSVTPVYWPDFGKENLVQAIEDFNKRQRRFGGRINAN